MHRAAGWPLIMLSSQIARDAGRYNNDTRMVHVLAQRPDKLVVDIEGARTINEALNEWAHKYADIQAEAISEQDLLALLSDHDPDRGLDNDYSPLERAVTRDFAARLIDGRLT